jgi:hypothetical protein
MRKQFGRRPRVGENHAAGALGVYATHANENLWPLPSGSVDPRGSSLKRFNASDAFRDVVAVGFVLLFVLSVALAFVGGIFLCFFCQF